MSINLNNLNNVDNTKLIKQWAKLINSIEFDAGVSTEFIDKINITFLDEDKPNNSINVKALRLNTFITPAQVDDLIEAALFQVEDLIKHLDLTVDIEAVMKQAIPQTKHYLKELNV
jgi:hypothetical protein